MVIFNVVIVLSFLFVFLFPLLLLGPSYFSVFLSRNWIAGLLFVLALAAVNTYFGANWRLFTHLEREDWPSLVAFLEGEVYRKGRIRAKQIRLLANAYLITSSSDKTRSLEAEVRRRRPILARRLALQFAVPYLLAAGSDESEKYFADMAAQPGVAGREWLQWNHAFCLCRRGERGQAAEVLGHVLDANTEPVLELLALYLLATACADLASSRGRVEQGKAGLVARYPPGRWKTVVEKARGNLEVVVLSKVIDDAVAWLEGRPEKAEERLAVP